MSISFHDVLKNYFFEIENKLEAEKNLSAIFPNNSDKGIIRESVYAKFLIDHLPANAEVLFGGFLFNKEGDVSPQYDILIVHSSAPKFNVNGKCFASVDACIAIISIKTNLTNKPYSRLLRIILSRSWIFNILIASPLTSPESKQFRN